MQITHNTLDTSPGPADWFTGTVLIDTIAAAPPLGAAAVHFTPGARTAGTPTRTAKRSGSPRA